MSDLKKCDCCGVIYDPKDEEDGNFQTNTRGKNKMTLVAYDDLCGSCARKASDTLDKIKISVGSAK
jgi:hypothetical protein